MNHFKKVTFLSIIPSLITLSSTSYAQTPTLTQDQIQAIAELSNVSNLTTMLTENADKYLSNSNLPKALTNQTIKQKSTSNSKEIEQSMSDKGVFNSLAPISFYSYDLSKLTANDAKTISQHTTQWDDTLVNATTGLFMSDLPALAVPFTPVGTNDPLTYGGNNLTQGNYGLPIKANLKDNYLSASTLMDVDNYDTSEKQTAAKYFNSFITGSLQPLNSRLLPDLGALGSALSSASTDDNNAVSANILRAFLNSTTTQQYLLDMRSYTAKLSLTNSSLNTIYAERMPYESADDPDLDTLYRQIHPGSDDSTMPPNVYDSDGKIKKDSDGNPLYYYPSKREVTKFTNTHDLKDKDFYSHVASESLENIARDQLIATKQTNAMLDQLHQDNEEIMLELTNVNMLSLQNAAQQIATEANTINTWISTGIPNDATPDTAINGPSSDTSQGG